MDRRKQLIALKKEMQQAMKSEKDRRKRNQIQADYETKMATLKRTDSSQPTEEEEENVNIDLDKFSFVEKDLSKSERKAQDKKQREKQKHQKLLNNLAENDRSHAEEAGITQELAGKRKVVPIAPDGSCLFRAIAHQLELHNKGKECQFRSIRKMAADYMKDHRDDFVFFLEEEHQEAKAFNRFCDAIATSDEYGGELEITALSRALKLPIRVIKCDGQIVYGEGAPRDELVLTFHRYLYGSPHYNSTVPVS